MRTLLTAALLFATLAQAAPVAATPVAPLRSLVLAQAEEDEEEGEEEEAEEAAGEEAPAPAAEPGPATPAPAEGEAAAPAARPRGELVSGAPLANPDVAVHIVERKRFADKGRHELTLYPAVAQANGKFTQHFGSALAYTYHLQENFALQVTPQFNWSNSESGFNQELVGKVNESATAASALLLQWGAVAGFEVTPIYGKFAFFEENLLQFGLVLNAGAGVGTTRVQLVPPLIEGGVRTADPTFGEAGMRFLGSVGGGFRVQVGDRFAVRLEVRDLVYTARVDRVNGCNLDELDALVTNRSAPVGAACSLEAFEATDEKGNDLTSANLTIASDLVRTPSSDALNLVSFYAGLSYLF